MIALASIKPDDFKKNFAVMPYRLIKQSFLDKWVTDQVPHVVEFNEIEKRIFALGNTLYCSNCTDKDWTDFVTNFGPLPTA